MSFSFFVERSTHSTPTGGSGGTLNVHLRRVICVKPGMHEQVAKLTSSETAVRYVNAF